jgi:hypothetical protein
MCQYLIGLHVIFVSQLTVNGWKDQLGPLSKPQEFLMIKIKP